MSRPVMSTLPTLSIRLLLVLSGLLVSLFCDIKFSYFYVNQATIYGSLKGGNLLNFFSEYRISAYFFLQLSFVAVSLTWLMKVLFLRRSLVLIWAAVLLKLAFFSLPFLYGFEMVAEPRWVTCEHTEVRSVGTCDR